MLCLVIFWPRKEKWERRLGLPHLGTLMIYRAGNNKYVVSYLTWQTTHSYFLLLDCVCIDNISYRFVIIVNLHLYWLYRKSEQRCAHRTCSQHANKDTKYHGRCIYRQLGSASLPGDRESLSAELQKWSLTTFCCKYAHVYGILTTTGMQSEVPAAWWRWSRVMGGYIWKIHRVSLAQEGRVTEAATNDYTYLPLPRVQEAAVGRESGGTDR